MQVSEADLRKIKEHLSDKTWRMANLYFIKDKNNKEVLFKPNLEQSVFRSSKHNRNIILKARQLGFTTDAVINALDNCLFSSNYTAGIICDSADNAEKIFHHKVKFAFEKLPQWLRDRRKPNTDRAGELRFPNGSSISVSTGYRGGTLSSLHVSEYGRICKKFPLKAKEIKSGAFEAVPMNGEITVESTAEGMSGDFYSMYEIASDDEGQELTNLDFKLHFFPWWKSIDYRLDPKNIKLTEENEKYFSMLKDEQGIELDDWQKAWYQKKENNQDDMKQEYPSFPIEAFMASGRPVFNQQKIARDIRRAKDRKFTLKSFEVRGKLYQVKIYIDPVETEAYALGADVAEGLEEGDGSTISVLNKKFQQCASYYGTIDPSDHGRLIVAVGKYYNIAVVAPEVNNHGHATIAAIKDEKYWQIYKRKSSEEELGEEIQEKIGWLSTVKSKMKYLDDLKDAFKNDEIQINDEATLREMMTITIEDSGDIVMNGKDRTVALGISIQAIKQAVIPGTIGTFEPNEQKRTYQTKVEMLNMTTHEEETSF
jgi:hypothetical protein